MAKIKFDPNAKFETVASTKVKFDPTAKFDTVEEPSMLESGLRGAAQGASMGLADEATGALESLFTDKTYEQARDESRKAYANAQKANPKTYMAGELGGGIATAFIPGLGAAKGASLASTAGKAALQGGLTGFGSSEGDASTQIVDTLKGAALGGATGAAFHGIGKALTSDTVKEIPSTLRRAGNTAGQVVDAAKEGAKDTGFLGAITGPLAGAKKILELGGDSIEQRKLAEGFRKHLGPGHWRDMTDPEVIASMVHEGDDQAINYVAGRAGRISGIDPDDYARLLRANAGSGKGPSLEAARTFDFDQAGGDLSDEIGKMSDTLEQGTRSRRQALEDTARTQYNGDTNGILRNLEKQHAAAGELNSTRGAQGVLSDAYDVLRNGKNAEDLGLKPGNWQEHDGVEHFNRLQKVRQLLDDNIDWGKIKQGGSPTSVERKIMQVRGQVDEALKGASDAKIESDSMTQQYMKLKDTVLSGAKHKGEFDKYKTGSLLKDTQGSKRFRDNLDLLDQFIDQNDLDPKVASAITSFRDKFAGHLDTAELKRTLQKFETSTVGSSRSGRAAQAAESLQRGDDVLGEMIKAPEQALRTSHNVVSEAERFFNKPFSRMTRDEKMQIVKFQTAIKKQPDLDFVATVLKWQGK